MAGSQKRPAKVYRHRGAGVGGQRGESLDL